jgi:hypothetical protein
MGVRTMKRMTYEDFTVQNWDILVEQYKEDYGDDPTEEQIWEYVEEAYGTYCYYAASYNG